MDRESDREIHLATFRGIHNASKTKALMVLYDRLLNQGITTGLTALELHLASGVNYNTLRSRLSRWNAWGYVKRRGNASRGKPILMYTLGERGKHFLEDRVPAKVLKRFETEIQAWRSKDKGG